MTVLQELVEFSLNADTRKAVLKALDSTDKIIRIDFENFGVRLFKPNYDITNVELLVSTRFGDTFDVLAQYHRDGRVFLPRKYFEEFINLKDPQKLAATGIMAFSMVDNALIAAFSIESFLVVNDGEDATEVINEIMLEYYKVDDGEVNIYAHDKYGLNKNTALAVGIIHNGGLSVNPTILYKDDYSRLISLGLISSAKMLR